MDKRLYLIRGLPGIGKSTLARAILSAQYGFAAWHEADHFFNDGDEYRWYPAGVPAAHEQCQHRTESGMQRGCPCIVVSNTFTRRKELQPYLDMAERHGYAAHVITLEHAYVNDAELAARCVHAVPEATIARMRARWED